jgi:hypothetical protein
VVPSDADASGPNPLDQVRQEGMHRTRKLSAGQRLNLDTSPQFDIMQRNNHHSVGTEPTPPANGPTGITPPSCAKLCDTPE